MGSGQWAMSGTQLRQLRAFLDRLPASGITVWPRPSELIPNGLKIYQYHTTWLASESLGHTSPSLAVLRTRTELVQAMNDLGSAVNPPYMCIKRERSKLGNHAYFPEDDLKQPNSGCNLARLETMLMEEDRTSRGAFSQEFGQYPPRWFAQPFVAQIRYLGEIRCIIINGILLQNVYTVPSSITPDGKCARFETQLGYNILDSCRLK